MQTTTETPIAAEAYTSVTVARVIGVPVLKVQRWTDSGLVIPSIKQGRGHGNWHLFSFTDLVAFKTAAHMRAMGVSFQTIKRALRYLQQPESAANLANRFLVSDGREIYEKRGEDARSLVLQLDQAAFTWVIDLGAMQQELREALKKSKQS